LGRVENVQGKFEYIIEKPYSLKQKNFSKKGSFRYYFDLIKHHYNPQKLFGIGFIC